jgi:hypothetical protein
MEDEMSERVECAHGKASWDPCLECGVTGFMPKPKVSDQKPREFWVQLGTMNKYHTATDVSVLCDEVNSQITDEVHVIEATPKTLAAEEMYEILEMATFLDPKWRDRQADVLAKAGKR